MWAASRTNSKEIFVLESRATAKRTESQLRCSGRRGQDFAYPRLQDSSSTLSGVDSSWPGAEQVPRQLAPSGSRAGCGSARSLTRTTGMKNGQAMLYSGKLLFARLYSQFEPWPITIESSRIR